MVKFLLIDFEATDKEPKTARPIESAIHLLDKDLNELAPLESQVIFHESYPTISSEIEELTGISDSEVRSEGKPFTLVYNAIVRHSPDFIVAHNKGYDKTLFDSECTRQGMPLLQNPWICSYRDIKWPERQKCKKLSHLALDSGIMVDPKTLHRAAGDVRLLRQLLQEIKIDMMELAQRAMQPEITIRAIVPVPWNDGGKGKDKAKACGFGWETAPGTDGPKFEKAWVKRIKENELNDEKERLGYGIKIL